MQRELRVITLQGAIEKSTILLLQYWNNECLDSTIIILYFGGSYNIFADCTTKFVNPLECRYMKYLIRDFIAFTQN